MSASTTTLTSSTLKFWIRFRRKQNSSLFPCWGWWCRFSTPRATPRTRRWPETLVMQSSLILFMLNIRRNNFRTESATILTTLTKLKGERAYNTPKNLSLWARLCRLPLQRLLTSGLSSKATTSLKCLCCHCSLISLEFLKARRQRSSNCPWQQTAWKTR